MDVSANSSLPPQAQTVSSRMSYLVTFLFFAWGFSTVLIDTLIPKLKALFELSYAEVMLTQFCFFLGYLAFSIPAARVLARVGYVRAIVLGLVVMAGGCLLFAPAASLGVYPGFLLALFVMAAGITTLQVAANPFIAVLGPEQSAPSRLTLAQAFNSLGTTIGPLVGAWLILSTGVDHPAHLANAFAMAAQRRAEAHNLQIPFLAIAATLLIVAFIFWFNRPAVLSKSQDSQEQRSFRLLDHPRLLLGAVSLFAYVGAEVSIGSLMINYLMQPSVLAIPAADAGRLVSLYWGGAMVGRFIGSAVLRRFPPGAVLAACAIGAALLAIASSLTVGTTAAATLIAVGLCNSIMFPTIFAIALEGLGANTPKGSGILCMAIVGGAIIPVTTGSAADAFGLALALLVPAICYLWVATYGILARLGLQPSR
ncbi:MAG TPA: sugar MFS transporter [Rhizomicrobium sp.]|jgi:FHS family L-fucose permease-like MFS transporter